MIGKNSVKYHYRKKKDIYSHLNIEDITDVDHMHGKRVYKDFEIKNWGEYHNFYVQSDTLLLGDVFENFRDMCLEMYELDPAKFLSVPGLALLLLLLLLLSLLLLLLLLLFLLLLFLF